MVQNLRVHDKLYVMKTDGAIIFIVGTVLAREAAVVLCSNLAISTLRGARSAGVF